MPSVRASGHRGPVRPSLEPREPRHGRHMPAFVAFSVISDRRPNEPTREERHHSFDRDHAAVRIPAFEVIAEQQERSVLGWSQHVVNGLHDATLNVSYEPSSRFK